MKVKWKDGTQNFDAQLLSAGALVDRGLERKELYIEVTTAVHENDHIVRKILHGAGGAFGPKGIKTNPQTGDYVSQPYVYDDGEHSEDLAEKIFGRIKAKTKISYPDKTALIIQCFLDTLFFEDEWENAIKKVGDRAVQHTFREIFVFDSNHHYAATLHGISKSRNLL